jgi:hypothetical protein
MTVMDPNQSEVVALQHIDRQWRMQAFRFQPDA